MHKKIHELWYTTHTTQLIHNTGSREMFRSRYNPKASQLDPTQIRLALVDLQCDEFFVPPEFHTVTSSSSSLDTNTKQGRHSYLHTSQSTASLSAAILEAMASLTPGLSGQLQEFGLEQGEIEELPEGVRLFVHRLLRRFTRTVHRVPLYVRRRPEVPRTDSSNEAQLTPDSMIPVGRNTNPNPAVIDTDSTTITTTYIRRRPAISRTDDRRSGSLEVTPTQLREPPPRPSELNFTQSELARMFPWGQEREEIQRMEQGVARALHEELLEYLLNHQTPTITDLTPPEQVAIGGRLMGATYSVTLNDTLRIMEKHLERELKGVAEDTYEEEDPVSTRRHGFRHMLGRLRNLYRMLGKFEEFFDDPLDIQNDEQEYHEELDDVEDIEVTEQDPLNYPPSLDSVHHTSPMYSLFRPLELAPMPLL